MEIRLVLIIITLLIIVYALSTVRFVVGSVIGLVVAILIWVLKRKFNKSVVGIVDDRTRFD